MKRWDFNWLKYRCPLIVIIEKETFSKEKRLMVECYATLICLIKGKLTVIGTDHLGTVRCMLEGISYPCLDLLFAHPWELLITSSYLKKHYMWNVLIFIDTVKENIVWNQISYVKQFCKGLSPWRAVFPFALSGCSWTMSRLLQLSEVFFGQRPQCCYLPSVSKTWSMQHIKKNI